MGILPYYFQKFAPFPVRSPAGFHQNLWRSTRRFKEIQGQAAVLDVQWNGLRLDQFQTLLLVCRNLPHSCTSLPTVTLKHRRWKMLRNWEDILFWPQKKLGCHLHPRCSWRLQHPRGPAGGWGVAWWRRRSPEAAGLCPPGSPAQSSSRCSGDANKAKFFLDIKTT